MARVAHDWHHAGSPLNSRDFSLTLFIVPSLFSPRMHPIFLLQILELLKRNDFHYKEGDTLAFPPAPKWRPEHRDKM